MRSRLIALAAVVPIGVVLIGGSALAQASSKESKLPDLPGMGVAGRATRGEVARFETSDKTSGKSSTDSTSTTSSNSGGFGGFTGSSAVKADEPLDTSSISDLPGTSAVPLIGQVAAAFRRGIEPIPAGLAAFAALGTILSVGSFLALRRRLAP